MLTVKLALRNLWRHKRRTLITSSAISLGLGMMMFSSGGTDGMTNSMIANGVGSAAGHVVIQHPDYADEPEADLVVADTGGVVSRLGEILPEATIVRRIYLDGLLTSPDGAMGVALTAVEPSGEAQVNSIDEKMVAGEYLSDADDRGIVLGSTLAESLDVGLGDKVVLMTQGEEEMISRLFRVRGVFSMGIDEIDGFYAQIHLAAAQEMLGLGGDVTQITAHVPSARDAEGAAARAKEAFAGSGLAVLSWQEALPDLAEYVAAEQGEIYVFYSIIFAMVALGIVNTVLMSVLERMREFGVMLSLGSTPGLLARLVFTESALLGLFATAAGVALGLLANWPLATHGLDMSQLVGGTLEAGGFALDMVIYSDLSPVKTVCFAVFVWCLTMLAAIYPAYKAATLKPVECLQHR